eukprot:CAMPEP_0175040798 /NCGR_PEP_ID=MMETSP0052_2-20121109/1490_1 /TAXON_ID=51329 ORGANISM="Polytomella parva, Strain SAG 63-3" /NCGR_SAMPLE_ID=MMETSP0052_2 /ASSEMBLY_ACC=CAM_ASM_000194 /LENGTH=470 /DNA_ID=CAMNT_0016303103 /DNA_START=182 /DNA_END=1591 /DNA_ORIENTATION=+
MWSKLLTSLLACFLVACLQLGSAAREIKPNNSPRKTSSADLTFKTFNKALENEAYVLVEFYSSWCPACRNYAPTYDAISAFLKDTKLSTGKNVFPAKVDCVTEKDLCKLFSIQRYPTIFFGSGSQFLKGPSSVKELHGDRSINGVLSFINDLMMESLKYVHPSKKSDPPASPLNLTPLPAPLSTTPTLPSKSVWHIDDVEKATMMLFETIRQANLTQRSAVLDIVSVFAISHPSGRCRRGADRLSSQFDLIWPASSTDVPDAFSTFRICPGAEPLQKQPWRACKGSKPDSRGYTCGLWTLFHALSAQLPENEDAHVGEKFVKMLKAFGTHFFQCSTCRDHFLVMLEDFTTDVPPPSSNEMTTRIPNLPKDKMDLVLLVWKMHNVVNTRLAEEEMTTHSFSGDPLYPKGQFPSHQQCKVCFRNTQTEDEETGKVDEGGKAAADTHAREERNESGKEGRDKQKEDGERKEEE